ncbi:MAG: hypothetical protein M1822_003213 [Bathelium mastoideum]|nr:MAG: hypothetical protein M1822_003213 [Bathelium mastoideum]
MASLNFNDPTLASEVAKALERIHQVTELDDWIFIVTVALFFYFSLKWGLLWERPNPDNYKFFERPQELLQGHAAPTSESRNIAERLEQEQADVVIFFGSQSGTAEGFAEQLRRELQQRFRLRSLVADLSDYEHDTFGSIPSSKPAIFLMSTYGEGDPSDNATRFLDWIKSQSGKPLSNLSYAAFGLGNSNYKYYNAVVDTTVAALDAAGANLLIPVGKADEAEKTTKEDFARWKESLRTWFMHQHGLQEYDPVYEPSVLISEENVHLESGHDHPIASKAIKGQSAIEELQIIDRNELTSGNDATRSCLHINVDLSSKPSLRYKTGDHIALWPVNPDEEVMRLIHVLGLDHKKDVPISIMPLESSSKLKLPSQTTIHSLFRYHLEICSTVSREVASSLAQFTSDPALKSSLEKLTVDIQGYNSYISHNYVTLGRLLQGLLTDPSSSSPTTCQNDAWHAIPLSFVVESLSPLTARYYSISSSPAISPRQLSITVAVNRAAEGSPHPTSVAIGRTSSQLPVIIPGLTTTYLSTNPFPPKIFVSVKRSTFKLPPPSVPLLLVAAGTGIAPFRAFILERLQLRKLGHSPAPVVLFYGCRHPEIDFLYKKEFDAAVDEYHNASNPGSVPVEIIPSYSRHPSMPRQYVQDLLAQHSEKVGTMLVDDNAAMFICGAAAMAREVGKVVDRAVATKKGWDSDSKDIGNWRRERKSARRWSEDVWG